MAIPSMFTIAGSGMGSPSAKTGDTSGVSKCRASEQGKRQCSACSLIFKNVPLGIFHAYGKRELDGAGSGLIDCAWLIVQLPAHNLIVMAAYCPNVSILVVDYFDCDLASSSCIARPSAIAE